ncbi:hypothetical protein [Bacillus sp. AFS041924]|uniref:hypothetical protein n=1 Tax=Bacillus sp. AFS041924 TaxID=2033503 RepID=UPI000BFCE1E5|nr:hypothetical protein COC46_00330 [Bacillus sp. AFS041924]
MKGGVNVAEKFENIGLVEDRYKNLKADCESCFGLCCVALPFAASADFANDKIAGKPCYNLQSDYRCGVHNNLRELGFKGCTVFDCFGAGQKVSQVTFNGNDWRQNPELANEMYEVFPKMKQLHEMLWYLNESLILTAASEIHHDIKTILEETERLTQMDAKFILNLDIILHRTKVNSVLLRASEQSRAEALNKFKNNKKLRDANLSGADLTGCIFLTQAQINSAKGDYHTKIPVTLRRPSHW